MGILKFLGIAVIVLWLVLWLAAALALIADSVGLLRPTNVSEAAAATTPVASS